MKGQDILNMQLSYLEDFCMSFNPEQVLGVVAKGIVEALGSKLEMNHLQSRCHAAVFSQRLASPEGMQIASTVKIRSLQFL